MFTTLIVRPIFNLLVFIYAILPGHNFGLAIIVFTIVVRLLMWPLVKKQLHHAKAMRELQPELKRIKQASKGNKQQESMMIMELYKERQINPFSSLGIVLLQLPILIGLYAGLKKIVVDPEAILTFSYPFLRNLSWMKQLSSNIHLFDGTLFGVVNLTRAALGKNGSIYLPAMVIVLGSAAGQYFQTKQLMPNNKESKSLRNILKDAGKGRQADQGEVNAAVGRTTRYFIPAMIFLFTVNIASALPLYWLAGSIVAYIQQARVLNQDETEMVQVVEKSATNAKEVEGEVLPPAKKAKKSSTKKRRKR
ncbi:MAG: hypothetical protein JWS12_951 [Candidatus Saccharibacteria bacterium]|nr:hypothetical protein [Candidatus Saccharibacteria bacterium]